MTSDRDDVVAAAAQAIRAYLREHPLAKDTATGMAAWWLPHDSCAGPREVQDAIDRLLAEGFVEAQRMPGGAVVYGLSRRDTGGD